MTVTAVRDRKQAGAERFHWTVEPFCRAVAAGVFDEPHRMELIHGELWENEPVNPPHAFLTEEIAALLRRLLGSEYWVREEKPFHIADDGEPMPDVQVVDPAARRDSTQHPMATDVQLVVDVADASVDRDTGEKALVYAQAGIRDYWVSVVGTRELLVFRDPTERGYAVRMRLTDIETIRPLCAPGVEIAVRDLLFRSTAQRA